VKVDCTEETELCKGYGVEGYPTVKVFRGLDNIKPYSGARKALAYAFVLLLSNSAADKLYTASYHT
jgi:protein disulfide-isomerase A1